MSLFKEAYFCGQCKKLTLELDALLFVENEGQVGFCSEACIENFYTPWVEYFETLEKSWREANHLGDEEILEVVGHPVFMDQLLRRPSEVYRKIFEGGEHIYSFIVKINDQKYGEFHMMCLCLVYDNQPSFILTASATKEDKMIDNYRWGEKMKEPKSFHSNSEEGSKKDTIEIDENILQEVESKKSSYLAHLLEERSPADIPVESFSLYEAYFEPTMMDPDEIFSRKDEEGDVIYTYIKAHDREGVSFYYFIVCLRIEKGFEENKDALVPIISFPSVDGDIYRTYREGELISGNLKN